MYEGLREWWRDKPFRRGVLICGFLVAMLYLFVNPNDVPWNLYDRVVYYASMLVAVAVLLWLVSLPVLIGLFLWGRKRRSNKRWLRVLFTNLGNLRFNRRMTRNLVLLLLSIGVATLSLIRIKRLSESVLTSYENLLGNSKTAPIRFANLDNLFDVVPSCYPVDFNTKSKLERTIKCDFAEGNYRISDLKKFVRFIYDNAVIGYPDTLPQPREIKGVDRTELRRRLKKAFFPERYYYPREISNLTHKERIKLAFDITKENIKPDYVFHASTGNDDINNDGHMDNLDKRWFDCIEDDRIFHFEGEEITGAEFKRRAVEDPVWGRKFIDERVKYINSLSEDEILEVGWGVCKNRARVMSSVYDVLEYFSCLDEKVLSNFRHIEAHLDGNDIENIDALIKCAEERNPELRNVSIGYVVKPVDIYSSHMWNYIEIKESSESIIVVFLDPSGAYGSWEQLPVKKSIVD